jgi:hypothetical protein
MGQTDGWRGTRWTYREEHREEFHDPHLAHRIHLDPLRSRLDHRAHHLVHLLDRRQIHLDHRRGERHGRLLDHLMGSA